MITNLAHDETIPKKFLEQILVALKSGGFVASKKGKGGGYALAQPPEKITIGSVIRAIEGPIAPLPCASETRFRKCDEVPRYPDLRNAARDAPGAGLHRRHSGRDHLSDGLRRGRAGSAQAKQGAHKTLVSSRLATSLCGIPLKTPVLAASGTFAYGIELRDVVDLAELCGIITKGLSREPMEGNPAPRLYEIEAGMIAELGRPAEYRRASFRERQAPGPRAIPTPVFANIFGYAVEDYVEVVKVLEDAGRPRGL